MSASAVTGVTGGPAVAPAPAPAPAPATGGGASAAGGGGRSAIRNTIIRNIKYTDSDDKEHVIDEITIVPSASASGVVASGGVVGGAANFQQMIQNKLFKRKRNTRRKIVRRKSNKRK
jgi:hypothetical protein